MQMHTESLLMSIVKWYASLMKHWGNKMAGKGYLRIEGMEWNKKSKLWITELYGKYALRDEAEEAIKLKIKTNQAVERRPRTVKSCTLFLDLGGCLVAQWYLCQSWAK
jgi:hypothetical protein